VLLTAVNKTDSNAPKYSLLHTRQFIFNKPQVSLLKKPLRHLLVFRLYQQTLPNTYLHSSYRSTLQLWRVYLPNRPVAK